MLKLREFRSCEVVERGILLRLLMKSDIKSDKLIDSSVSNRLLAAPFAVGNDQLSELSAPVSEMIDADAVPA